YYAYL
ncbi:hypothetical protein VTL71DRAFT_9509, partial [Oculimacula yallundae]